MLRSLGRVKWPGFKINLRQQTRFDLVHQSRGEMCLWSCKCSWFPTGCKGRDTWSRTMVCSQLTCFARIRRGSSEDPASPSSSVQMLELQGPKYHRNLSTLLQICGQSKTKKWAFTSPQPFRARTFPNKNEGTSPTSRQGSALKTRSHTHLRWCCNERNPKIVSFPLVPLSQK